MSSSARARAQVALPPLIVGAAGFLQTFDGSSVTVALPAMARAMHCQPLELGTVITAYLVGAAAFLPMCGWLAERFGARSVFCVAVAMFALTSLICGIAPGIDSLVLARFAQGCAGAMLLPVGRVIVLAHVGQGDQLKAMGLMTTPVMLGALLGPPLGGLIVTVASWRWLFFANLPVALLGIVLILGFLPDVAQRQSRPFDGRGVALLSTALAGITIGVAMIAHQGISLLAAGAIAISMLAALGYRVHVRHTPHAVIQGHLFANLTFRASNIGGFFPRLLVSATPFLLALLFQVSFGLSAARTGELVMASALGSLPARGLLGVLRHHLTFRQILLGNALLVAGTVAACATLTAATPHAAIMALLFVQGLTRSLQLITLMALNYADVDGADMPTASTIASVSQQVAMSLGIAMAVAAVEFGRHLGSGTLLPTAMGPAFLLLAGLSLVSLLWILRLPPDAAMHLARPRPSITEEVL